MGNVAHLLRWDIVQLETQADHQYATGVMEIVLNQCGLSLQEAQAKLEDAHSKLGAKWADATGETIDVSYLYDMFHPSTESWSLGRL